MGLNGYFQTNSCSTVLTRVLNSSRHIMKNSSLKFSRKDNIKKFITKFLMLFHYLETIHYLETRELLLNFKKIDYCKLNQELSSIDWDYLLELDNINTMVESFYHKIFKIVEKYSSHYTISSQNPIKYPSWFSKNLTHQVQKKKCLHWIYKTHPNGTNYLNFTRQRKLCKKLSTEAFKDFIIQTESNIFSDPKMFWKYVKNGKNKNDYPSSMYLENDIITNGDEMVNAFARYFAGNFNTTVVPSRVYNFTSLSLDNIYISLKEVEHGLLFLNDNAGPGPDLIPVCFLKNSSEFLAKPLYYLFNSSLMEGRFPDLWKTSFITPIFKKGDKKSIKNYRPVTKLSLISKLFDQIMERKLSIYLSRFLVDEQHGFRKKKSTETNLCVYTKFIINAFQNKKQVDSVYTDLKSAFDSVNHARLLEKLEGYGIKGVLLKWLSSYLTDRNLVVKIGNFKSKMIRATSGVPQGSHCGPLFYNLSINDIGTVIQYCQFLLFADDLKVFIEVISSSQSNLLQIDLNAISKWMMDNGFIFNVQKCFVISFSSSNITKFNYLIDKNQIERVNSISDLGVIFDENLTFNPHIDSIVKKANRSLLFIFRNTMKFRNPLSFYHLYLTLVRPILNYNAIIWNPYLNYQETKLEAVQHRFLRYMSIRLNIPMSIQCHNYDEISNKLKCCTLKSFRIYTDLLFVFKLLNNYIDESSLLSKLNIKVPSRSLRISTNKFIFETVNVSSNIVINRDPLNRACLQINKLMNMIDIFDISLEQFKSKAKECSFRL